MKPLSIDGGWVYQPRHFDDDRGSFLEWFQGDRFLAETGRRLQLAQANCSISRRGVLRGVHYADVPPSQAKYVTCVRGAVRDVVVDLRTGSPTFGEWEAVELNDRDRNAVFLSEGLGHAFQALTDDATVVYLCSTGYSPGREHGINPLDPDLGIDWLDDMAPVLSAKDAAAPGLAQAEAAGLLPSYQECRAFLHSLASAISESTEPIEETP
ncbi:dTDP-4-dehydrorhamnose 3,5-epimerase [Streptantibioticus ferralitis]|uniref:dTDP-4-dehydrorhamnose 3,5-epimerase n=1 Tax=Streptantibioticus ferralitis TaxID=236510 RepID=A0ABT5YV38_9ACTN|nr:dTDP-4-dehydrorhamnose 3,5-epimerase [Streptantibioticus ferralitis]MDF2255469.1 dTDP-4-dehydrorhamnose 3,5-epimerase [Streptantibioticus ferralitis]